MNTETTRAAEPTAAKKTTKKPSEPRAASPSPSPILGVAPSARTADVEAAYRNYAAKVQAEHTAKTNIAQRDCSSEVQAHHREHEEARKYLKKSRTQALRLAQENKVRALREVQSTYDKLVNTIETENTTAVTDASHKFNNAVAPIHTVLGERKAKIDSDAKTALSAAQAEFVEQKAGAEERARVAAEAAAKKVELEAAKAAAAAPAAATDDDEDEDEDEEDEAE